MITPKTAVPTMRVISEVLVQLLTPEELAIVQRAVYTAQGRAGKAGVKGTKLRILDNFAYVLNCEIDPAYGKD